MRHACLWTLLVAACGDPTLYPKYSGLLPADTGLDGATGGGDVALVCGRAPEGTVARLDVVNQQNVAYELYVVDAGCNQSFMGRIEGGVVLGFDIANDLAWSVYDLQGRRVKVFSLPSGSGVQWVEYIP